MLHTHAEARDRAQIRGDWRRGELWRCILDGVAHASWVPARQTENPALVRAWHAACTDSSKNDIMNTRSSALAAKLDLPIAGMVPIPGGSFRMGSERHYPEEAPEHEVCVDAFWMDAAAVTNADFNRFVTATDYVTLAERPLDPGLYPDAEPELLVPGSAVFQMPDGPVDLRDCFAWWTYVPGADWRHPEGPDSSIFGRENHPVVHIAYEDAEAYARWTGKELPTEAEWERAARGGLEGAEYCWGERLAPQGRLCANFWQGHFPWENLLLDGFERTAPVGTFAPNGFGLFDMAGNVWEWTQDWFSPRHTPFGSNRSRALKNPRGPEQDSGDKRGADSPRKVIKGGSFLCSANYCYRYRPAARFPQTIDTSTCHIGFRCVIRTPH